MVQAVTTLAEPDNGRTIELRVGDALVLQLYENAATGYRWSFESLDRKVVTVRGEAYVRRSEAVGGGGHMQWTLTVMASGTTQIKLKRWRQWEGDVSIQDRFAVTLTVRP